eukprot:3214699-Prymnesium_polylepis.1
MPAIDRRHEGSAVLRVDAVDFRACSQQAAQNGAVRLHPQLLADIIVHSDRAGHGVHQRRRARGEAASRVPEDTHLQQGHGQDLVRAGLKN